MYMPICIYCHKELPNNGKKLIGGAKNPYYKTVKYCNSFCLKENWRFKHSPPLGSREKKCLSCKKNFVTGKFQPNRQKCCSAICNWKYYYSLNKERYYLGSIQWQKKNPEKLRESQRKYYWSHTEKVRLQKRARNTGHITEKQWISLCDESLYTCKHCNKVFHISLLSIDHIIPITLGGSNDISNLQPLCLPCNKRKGNRFIG